MHLNKNVQCTMPKIITCNHRIRVDWNISSLWKKFCLSFYCVCKTHVKLVWSANVFLKIKLTRTILSMLISLPPNYIITSYWSIWKLLFKVFMQIIIIDVHLASTFSLTFFILKTFSCYGKEKFRIKNYCRFV